MPTDFFDYLDWQAPPRSTVGVKVVRLANRRGRAPATMNRRIAAVRGLFEFAVTAGLRAEHPVPAARRSSGLRPKQRGLLGHLGPGRARGGGRLVRQARRLPESLELAVVRRRYNGIRLHAGIGYVTPDDEHQGRGQAIRKAREAGLEQARLRRLAYHRHQRHSEPSTHHPSEPPKEPGDVG